MGSRLTDTKVDKIFNFFVIAFSILLVLVCAYPIYLVMINSFSDPDLVAQGKVVFFPRGITIDAYKEAFNRSDIMRGYKNSLYYTVVGSVINMMLTIPTAYALSRPKLVGRNAIMIFFIITMYFSGGMIPTFLLLKELKLINTWWVIPLTNAVSVTNLIIARSFFVSSIPDALEEAAEIDGCNPLQSFWYVVLPLSKSMICVILLYYVVARWNNYVSALYYLPMAADKYPLQMVLREMLVKVQSVASYVENAELAEYYARMNNQIKYAVVVISSLPVLIIYPFVQKYFEKGIMIGSVKG